jgi:hypothetical protein
MYLFWVACSREKEKVVVLKAEQEAPLVHLSSKSQAVDPSGGLPLTIPRRFVVDRHFGRIQICPLIAVDVALLPRIDTE